MVNKKMIQLVTISIIVVFLAVSFASAGLLDSIKKVFGNEPQLAPFNASVTLQSVAPYIRQVINVTDYVSTVNQVDPIEGSIRNAYVTFVAHDDNSNADLPTTPGLGTGTGQISISLVKPAGVKSTLTVGGANVISCNQLSCNPTNCPSMANERMYVCNITGLQFYYEPRANWFVNVSITDMSGSQSLYNDTRLFEYLPRLAIDNTGNITWDSVALTSTNQRASTNLTLVNRGNVLRNFARITAYNLTGTSYPGTPLSYIPAIAFSANGTMGSACNSATSMLATENSFRDISGFSLDYGPSVSTTLYFCIYPALNTLGLSLIDTTYSATGFNYPAAGTRTWVYTVI